MRMYMLLMVFLTIALLGCKPAEQYSPPAEQQDVTAQQETKSEAEPAEKVVAPQEVACNMTMGIDAWEPYQYMTVGDTVAGLDVELVQAVVETMNCKLDVVQGSWMELLTLLREGKVDFVMGASKTEDRLEFAYFSDSYRQERFQLYVRLEHANLPITDLKSFVEAGHKVGVVNEYYYGDEVAALYADETLRTKFIGAIISELNMARLLDEEIDGLLEDSYVGASLLRRKGLDKYIQPHNISLGASDVYVMFSKLSVTEPQVQQFNAGLSQIRENGTYNKIVEKYSN